MAELHLNMSEETYHSDPCPTPSLSNSIANVLLDRSPLHAHSLHPQLGGRRSAPTPATDRGALIHALMLGRGPDIVPIFGKPDDEGKQERFKDWRKKEAKQLRADARAAGKIPVLPDALDDAREAADALTARLRDDYAIVFEGGDPECVITWENDTDNGPIWCRARLDYLMRGPGIVYDLKSAADAGVESFVRSVISYGYDTQCAAYTDAVLALEPDLPDLIYRLIVVEPTPPYAVAVYELDASFKERGRHRWRGACDKWAWCLREKDWPGYEHAGVGGAVYLEPPGWLMAREGLK